MSLLYYLQSFFCKKYLFIHLSLVSVCVFPLFWDTTQISQNNTQHTLIIAGEIKFSKIIFLRTWCIVNTRQQQVLPKIPLHCRLNYDCLCLCKFPSNCQFKCNLIRLNMLFAFLKMARVQKYQIGQFVRILFYQTNFVSFLHKLDSEVIMHYTQHYHDYPTEVK